MNFFLFTPIFSSLLIKQVMDLIKVRSDNLKFRTQLNQHTYHFLGVAHQLLLDPFFQLYKSGGCSMENPLFHNICELLNSTFWDSLKDNLKLVFPCYVSVKCLRRSATEFTTSAQTLAFLRWSIFPSSKSRQI